MKRPHFYYSLLIIIVLSGFVLRIWGNTYGLPYSNNPDEWSKVKTSYYLKEKNFTHRNTHPSFLYNSLYIVFKIAAPFKNIFDRRVPILQTTTGKKRALAFYFWVARCWMATLDSLTILMVFFIAAVFWDRRAGLFSAFFYAFCPLPIAASHVIKEDIPLTFFCSLTLLSCFYILKYRRRRDYALSGFLSGVTCSSKYPGILTLFLILFTHILAAFKDYFSNQFSFKKSLRVSRPLLTVLLFFLIGFSVISPMVVKNFSASGKGISRQYDYISRGHHDGIKIKAINRFFTFYLRKSLIPGCTIPVCISAVIGMVWIVTKRKSCGYILLFWVLWYYFIAELSPAKPYPFFSRYILPVIPGICVLSGYFTSSLLSIYKHKKTIVTGLVIFILITPAYYSLRYASSIFPGAVTTAYFWINKNIPANSILLVSQYSPFNRSSKAIRKTDSFEIIKLDLESYETYRRKQEEKREIYFIISSFHYQRYLDNPGNKPKMTGMYRQIMKEYPLIKEFLSSFKPFGFNNPVIKIYLIPAAGQD